MSDTPEFLKIACEQFLGMDVNDIKSLLLDTFEGHLRAIVGSMDVEELFQDREKFAELVREHASADVSKMGIKVLSFTIKDIEDSLGYLEALGQEQTSNIKSKAAILEAAADRAAYIREEECQKESLEVKYETDTLIADYEKTYETKKAEYLTAVGEARAEAALSYELESSKQQQIIVAEELNVDLVQKKYSIQVQEKEILRAEKELISSSTLPAEARAYETKLMAEASKTQKTTKAQTDAQATRLNGKAEADALEAVGKAMALEMSLKAESYASYGEAATMSLVLEKLPQIATEVARPLAKINDIVVVGGKGGMTMEATKFLAELPQTVKAVTGYDITGLIGEIPGAKKI